MIRTILTGVVLLVIALAAGAEPAKNADGTLALFNGKDLSGWDGNPKFWSVQDGAITGQTTKENPTQGNTFLIWKDGKVKNFEIRLKFRMLSEEGNSGIQYRSKDHGNWVVGGYQADVDAGNTYTGILYEERGSRGIMAGVGEQVEWTAEGKKQVKGTVGAAKEIKDGVKKKEWNEYVVIAKGSHLIHAINGKVTVDVTDNDPKHQVAEGILALQLHAGPPMTIQFKDISLKVLDGEK
jgi:Domain of Unknown Function (DUF1080)